MAEDNGHKVIMRCLEYSGTPEWLEKVLAASRIPIQGVRQFPNGAFIKSGIVIYQTEMVNEVETDEQPVKTVQFKRPGE